MNALRIASGILLATAASAAFAVAPAPGALDPKTGEVVGFVQTPWSVANYGLMPTPKQMAGFQARPWAVERSAYYVGDMQVARGRQSGADRGRL
ncbi:MAG TPA: hypothetical protein VNM24_15555 [Burkholderiales bacterium]|jgi:hypothetical protein|nr:hypothetical protein [Burkholderiales bacterium]